MWHLTNYLLFKEVATTIYTTQIRFIRSESLVLLHE